MNIYPEILDNLIEYLKKIPGIGERTAERYALSLLKLTGDELDDFSNIIKNIKVELQTCKICGHLTDNEICSICNDDSRNSNVICVVEDYKNIFAFEKTGKYSGVYHVINGLISPIDGVNPEDLNIASLIKRCENNNDVEIIVALRPSIEGETTTLYLKRILQKYNIKVTRLSYGIPIGAELDYLDVLTLERALDDRKEVE